MAAAIETASRHAFAGNRGKGDDGSSGSGLQQPKRIYFDVSKATGHDTNAISAGPEKGLRVAMRRRFFVERFDGATAVMGGDAAHHLGRVLRAEVGQLYELSDGEAAWLARVEQMSRDRVEFSLVERIVSGEPALDLTLLLSIVKFDAFEWALEKATELGVKMVVPMAAARSEKALLHAAEKRAERWKKILLE